MSKILFRQKRGFPMFMRARTWWASRAVSEVWGRSGSRAVIGLATESAHEHPDLKPPLLDLSIALLFFKSRVL
jgi:hypothetical protein